MTNYERICADKAFCAWLLASETGFGLFKDWLTWLGKEQVKLNDEREHKEGV